MALGLMQPCPALQTRATSGRSPACDAPLAQGSLFG